MCCRYQLREEHYRELLARLGIEAPAKYLSRYNIAPGSTIVAVRPKTRHAGREAVALRWGLTPAWSQSDEAESRLTNARAETLGLKPSFRDAARSRRCVIPASGFYEWQVVGRERRPWLFRLKDESPFGLAGIWERWTAPDGTPVESCAIITSQPNEVMRPIHHRMPVILGPQQFDSWLDPRRTDICEFAEMLQPASAKTMAALAVSSYVSNVQHEGPECLALRKPDAPEQTEPQLSLGL